MASIALDGLEVVLVGGETAEGWTETVDKVTLFSGEAEALTPIPQPSVGFAFAAVSGRLYLLGGVDLQEEVEVAEVSEFDLASSTWLRGTPALQQCRAFAAAAAMAEEATILIAGGHAGEITGYLDTSEWLRVADAARARAWHAGPTMLHRRADHALVASSSGLIYAVAGRDGGAVLSSAEVLDGVGGQWRSLPPLQTPRAKCTAVAPNNARFDLMVAGGFDDAGYLASVEAFTHEIAHCWTSLAPLSVPRSGGASLSYQESDSTAILVFGGEQDGAFVGAVESWNEIASSWEMVMTLSTPRAGFALATLPAELEVFGFG